MRTSARRTRPARLAGFVGILLGACGLLYAHGGVFRPPRWKPPGVRFPAPPTTPTTRNPPDPSPTPGGPGGITPPIPTRGGTTPTARRPGGGGTTPPVRGRAARPGGTVPTPRGSAGGITPRPRGRGLKTYNGFDWRRWWFYHQELFLHAPVARISTPRGGEGPGKDALTRTSRAQAQTLLRKLLEGSDDSLKPDAAIAAGRIGLADALPLLGHMLVSADGKVRTAATMGIAALGSRKGIRILERVAINPKIHRFERCAAVAGLGFATYPDRQTIQVLRDLASAATHDEIRGCAFISLARLHAGGTVSLLRGLLLSRDTHAFTRANAATALGKSGDVTAVAPLVQALRDDPHPSVRAAAAMALGALLDRGDRLPGASPLPHDGPDPATVRAARKMAGAALAAKVRKGGDWNVRCLSAISLGRMAEPAGLTLLAGVATKPPSELRAAACIGLALGGERARFAQQGILNLLLDASQPDRDRAAAAAALGILGQGNPRVRKVLRGFATRNDGENVRTFSCLALGLLRDTGSYPLLSRIVLARNGDASQRTGAAYGLALTGGRKGMETLRAACEKETNPEMRLVLLRALGCSGNPQAPAAAAELVAAGPIRTEDLPTGVSTLGHLFSRRRPPSYAMFLADRNYDLDYSSMEAMRKLQ